MPCSTDHTSKDLEACWVCASTDTREWKPASLERRLESDDLRITDDRYGVTLALRRCNGCGFIFADGEEMDQLTGLYADLDDPGYEDSQEPRRLQMQWLLELAEEQCPEARTMLDVGAASGLLVAEGDRRGLDACGIEPSAALVAAAERTHGVKLVCGTLPHPALGSHKFDIVFLVDVLEHVSDPVALLEQCAAMLNDDGVFVVVTPDVGSMAARMLRRRWWHYRLAHVGYFDAATLDHAAARAGLTPVVKRRAKWFFTIDYLASRAEQYLPIGGLNRAVRKSSVGRKLYETVTPLDLRDSYVMIARRAPDETDDRGSNEDEHADG